MEHQNEIQLEGKDELKKIKGELDWLFYWETVGTVLVYAALVELQSIQTSLNITGNLGAIALTSAYVSAILYSFFLAPLTLRVLGLSKTMILCNISYLAFNLANYYPVAYILIPGAIISGIARSVLLPACTMTIFQLAESYQQCGSKTMEHYVSKYQGRFYSIFNSVGVIGNLLSSIIIFAGSAISDSNSEKEFTSETTTPYFPLNFTENSGNYTGTPITTSKLDVNDFSDCGINDCQDPNAVQENIDEYVPPDQGTIYVLISSSIILNLTGILIHWIIYPGIGRFGNKLQIISEEIERAHNKTSGNSVSSCRTSDGKDHLISLNVESDGLSIGEEALGEVNLAYSDGPNENGAASSTSFKKRDRRPSSDLSEYSEKDSDPKVDRIAKTEENVDNSYFKTLRITFLFYLRPRAILLSLFGLHYGMIIGFLFSDITRAYASCVTGVQSVGIYMACMGISAIFWSFLYSRWGKRIGRNLILVIEFCVEFSVLLACYLWVPDTRTIEVVFAIFFGAGFCIGTLRPILVIVYAEYFPDARRIAVTVWNFWITLGLCLEYGLSTVMCIEDKIYMQFSVLIASSLLYAIAEFYFLKERRQAEKLEISDSTSTEDDTRF